MWQNIPSSCRCQFASWGLRQTFYSDEVRKIAEEYCDLMNQNDFHWRHSHGLDGWRNKWTSLNYSKINHQKRKIFPNENWTYFKMIRATSSWFTIKYIRKFQISRNILFSEYKFILFEITDFYNFDDGVLYFQFLTIIFKR